LFQFRWIIVIFFVEKVWEDKQAHLETAYTEVDQPMERF
ncbi:hypothetical protein CFOL_v3_15908, partial [Cephalotus follicularis]